MNRQIAISLVMACMSAMICSLSAGPTRAEHDGVIQILLLGDSTTEASIPRRVAPREPQFEDMIRLLLAAEGDLPPTNVINAGVSGEYVRRLLDSGRYEKDVSHVPGLDYIFIRYGINDIARIDDFEAAFPRDLKELIQRLRKDHPQAMLIPTTIIPWAIAKDGSSRADRVNPLIFQVAAEERLTVFDLHPRYRAEMDKGPTMLWYRRCPLEKIPQKYHAFVEPFVLAPAKPDQPVEVVVLDNRLDAHFGHLEGWYGDQHPNQAGYHVMADETVKFLAPVIRARRQRGE